VDEGLTLDTAAINKAKETRLLKNVPFCSPRRRLYLPACKPYGLEAEPEAQPLRQGGLEP